MIFFNAQAFLDGLFRPPGAAVLDAEPEGGLVPVELVLLEAQELPEEPIRFGPATMWPYSSPHIPTGEELDVEEREGSDCWARRAAALLARVPDDELRAQLREDFEERAGIMEYDGGLLRREAEKMSLVELQATLTAYPYRDIIEG